MFRQIYHRLLNQVVTKRVIKKTLIVSTSAITAGLSYHLYRSRAGGSKAIPQPNSPHMKSISVSLHSRAATGNAHSIKDYINDCGLDTFNKMVLETTCRGNNPLHLAAKHNTSRVVEALTQQLDNKTSVIARQMNDDAKLPIDLVEENDNAILFNRRFYSALQPPTLKHTLSDIKQPIDVDKMLLAYSTLSKQSPAYHYLKLSALAINESRKILNASCTHPTTNTLSRKKWLALSQKIDDMRSEYKLSWLQTSETHHELILKESVKRGLGNCGEYGHVILDILKKMRVNTTCEHYFLQYTGNTGSHAVVVIGRDPKSNAFDHTTWGENAVVCDAWSGETYLAREIPSRLQYWRFLTLDNTILGNVCGPLNTKVHSLYPSGYAISPNKR